MSAGTAPPGRLPDVFFAVVSRHSLAERQRSGEPAPARGGHAAGAPHHASQSFRVQGGIMATDHPVVVYPPTADGGRRVRIDDHFVGIAYSVLDIAAFVQEAGLQDWDEMDVVRSSLIEWRSGGPDVWTPN